MSPLCLPLQSHRINLCLLLGSFCRHLEMVVNKRRRLLAWLRRSNPSAYTLCLQQLGLGDVFGESVSVWGVSRAGVCVKVELWYSL